MNYKGHELSCSQDELDTFVNGLGILKQTYPFTQKFQGTTIDNPTGNAEALYYVLQVNGRVFLQPHSPYDSGMVALTKENVESIIEKHVEELIDMEVLEKYIVHPEDEVTALKRRNVELTTLTDDLKSRNASMQDDQLFILEALAKAGLI